MGTVADFAKRFLSRLLGKPQPFRQVITDADPDPLDSTTLPEARARIIELEFALTAKTDEVTRLEGINDEQAGMLKRWNKLWEDVINVQERILRRVFRLPEVLGRCLRASDVSPGTLHGDSTVLFNILGPDGPWLELQVTPFVVANNSIKSTIKVIDASGKQEPLIFELCNSGTGDFYASMLRELIGFGEFAKRNVEDTPGTLVNTINKELAHSADLISD